MLVKWKGIQLVPTRSSYYEMMDLGFDLYDVLDILENGRNCARSRRQEGTFEKCLKRKGRTYKAVVVRSMWAGCEVL